MTSSDNNNGEVYQAIEAEPHPLRWLWWLLGALLLAGILFGIASACTLGNYRGSVNTGEILLESPNPYPDTVMQCGAYEVHFMLDDYNVLHSTVNGEGYTLPNVVSADGAKYSDGHMTLWESHGEWMMIRNEGAADEETIQCILN